MGWEDTVQRRPASYRGVEFEVASSERSGGRRHAEHLYPGKDRALIEDLGRMDRVFRVTGWVVGEDYLEKRDRLLTALETPGKGGNLVHPYYGIRPCFAKSFRVSESAADGGMARFSIQFQEVGDPLSVIEAKAPTEALEQDAAALATAAEDEYTAEFVTAVVPEAVRAAPVNAIQAIGAKLNSLDVFSGPAQQVAGYANQVQGMIGSAQSLVTSPADMIASMKGSVEAIIDTAQNASRAFFAYEVLLLELGIDSSLGGDSATSKAAKRNAELVVGLAKAHAAAGAARALGRITWDSLDQALATRDRLLAQIQALTPTASDALYGALTALRTTVATAVPPTREKLPRLAEFTLGESVPAMLLSFWLYGTPDRGEELASRNGARNPLALPARVPLAFVTEA